jgi:hypothetical protein
MNTLADLRATLKERAVGLHDTGRYVRSRAVQARVRAVRRRRAAVAGSAAAALVVAGAATAGVLLGRPSPVPPADHVAGVEVPRHLAVYGFPYDLTGTRTVPGGSGRVRLDGADRWQAVSLAASGLGAGTATLLVDGQPVARATGDGDVEVPVPLYDGTPDLRVRLDGAPEGARAGLAVYQATGGLPAGVTNGHAVFRDEVAGSRLRAGAFSQAGESVVTVPFSGGTAATRIADYCTTPEKGLWLNVALDGKPVLGTSCDASDDVDAGDGGSSFGRPPAGSHELRAYLTRGPEGPRVPAPDASFGVAVYDEPAGEHSVLGMRVAQQVELDGRTWRLERIVPQGTPGTPVRTTVDASDGDRVVGQVAAGRMAWTTWRGSSLHGESTRMGSAPGARSAGMSVDTFLPGGDRYRVTLHGTSTGGARSTGFRGALLVYRPE